MCLRELLAKNQLYDSVRNRFVTVSKSKLGSSHEIGNRDKADVYLVIKSMLCNYMTKHVNAILIVLWYQKMLLRKRMFKIYILM